MNGGWRRAAGGATVVFWTTLGLALLFVVSTSMSTALMPPIDQRPFEIPSLLKTWWSVSRWLYPMAGVVCAVGLWMLARTPRGAAGRAAILVAFGAETVTLVLDGVEWIMQSRLDAAGAASSLSSPRSRGPSGSS